MNILMDKELDDIILDVVSKNHKTIQISLEDVPSMPYDVDHVAVIAQWVYSKAVDNDVDLIMVKNVAVGKALKEYDITTISLC